MELHGQRVCRIGLSNHLLPSAGFNFPSKGFDYPSKPAVRATGYSKAIKDLALCELFEAQSSEVCRACWLIKALRTSLDCIHEACMKFTDASFTAAQNLHTCTHRM